MEATDRLVALLVGLFNIALAPQQKKMSAELTERLRTALYDAIARGEGRMTAATRFKLSEAEIDELADLVLKETS